MSKKGGPLDFYYVTADEMAKIDKSKSVEYWQSIAEKDGVCFCGQPIWRYGRAGMCFPCTTGESDASDDYEVTP